MILQLLGLVSIVVFTYFVFKTARDYDRSAGLWALATVGIGIGFQFVVPILITIVISIILLASGTNSNNLADAIGWGAFGISFMCLALSIVGMFLVLRHVAKLPDDIADSDIRVPPPPTFEGQD